MLLKSKQNFSFFYRKEYIMQEKKALQTILTVLKIVIAVILIGTFAYYATLLIGVYIETVNTVPPNEGVYIEPFPIAFALVLVFSVITNGICAFLSLVGLIISIVFRTSAKRKKNIVAFISLLVLPILLQIFIFLILVFI